MTIYELIKALEDKLQDVNNDYTLDTPVALLVNVTDLTSGLVKFDLQAVADGHSEIELRSYN